jgi:alpha-L-fucosidase
MLKRCITLILSALIVMSCATAQDHVFGKESLKAYSDRTEWFAKAQYGMFIHFGLYSHLGGEWNGEPVEWYAEWIQASRNIPRTEYAKIINEFNPSGFDAEFVVRTAKEAGMKYLVITAKHHEGFCLWDSAYTEFDIAGSALKGRDLLAELGKACKEHGIRFGIYYSIIDWHHPSQEPSMKGNHPFARWGQTVMPDGRKQDYVDYQTKQILELIRNYKPDLLWFDGDWVDWWTLDDGIRLYNAIRKAGPDIIVNNRAAKRDRFELDFVTQEQEHFENAFPRHWEGCYTMNKSWGYKKHDHEWKDAPTVYNKLKDINEKGGNLLLNVGPDGNGEIQPEAIAILKQTAALLKADPIVKNIPRITAVPGAN